MSSTPSDEKRGKSSGEHASATPINGVTPRAILSTDKKSEQDFFYKANTAKSRWFCPTIRSASSIDSDSMTLQKLSLKNPVMLRRSKPKSFTIRIVNTIVALYTVLD